MQNNSHLLDASLPVGLPVIVEDANSFIPLTYYTHHPGRPYYYVLDWESALRSPSLHATVQSKLMQNSRTAGYNSDRIIDTQAVACAFEKFLVLDSPGLVWFKERVFSNPQFAVELYADFAYGNAGPARVWLVTRSYRDPKCSLP